MSDEIKLDHFKNIEELKQNVETWIKEDEMYWNRWFSLYDLKTVLDYITNIQNENERLKELNVCVGCENNPDYKLRCEKALKTTNDLFSYSDNEEYVNNYCKIITNELNGLNDGDEE